MQNPVPFFTHSLTALAAILDKAEAFADARKIKPDVLPQLRLVADMLPLWRQVTIACDHAKGASARRFNLALGRQGSVWRDGFHERAIRSHENLRAAARYLVANPVRAGLVASVADYPFWDAFWLDGLAASPVPD